MQIGELARRLGTSADTVRFYEKSGWLPRATRRDNAYRDYGEDEVEHLRLLLELRRLGLPLAEAAQIAGWCHSGHCALATAVLPDRIGAQRRQIAERIASLLALDERLATLDRHLMAGRRPLPVLDAPPSIGAACCSAAGEVLASDAGCACCALPN